MLSKGQSGCKQYSCNTPKNSYKIDKIVNIPAIAFKTVASNNKLVITRCIQSRYMFVEWCGLLVLFATCTMSPYDANGNKRVFRILLEIPRTFDRYRDHYPCPTFFQIFLNYIFFLFSSIYILLNFRYHFRNKLSCV